MHLMVSALVQLLTIDVTCVSVTVPEVALLVAGSCQSVVISCCFTAGSSSGTSCRGLPWRRDLRGDRGPSGVDDALPPGGVRFLVFGKTSCT